MLQKLKDTPVEQQSMNVLADDDDEVNLANDSSSTLACLAGETLLTLAPLIYLYSINSY